MTEQIAALNAKAVSETDIRTKWGQLGLHNYIKIVIIATLFYFFYKVEIDRIIERWIDDTSWSHGFLIPLFSLYFLQQSKSEILNLRTKPNYLGLFFLICGILLYPLNVIQIGFGYLSPLSMIATLGAIVLFLGGWKLVKYTWLPVAYLVFAVPLPDRYYRAVTIPMRIWAATASATLLDMVKDVEATATGVIVDVVYKGQLLEPSLDVAEACSGMRLLMAFLALGVAMAYLHKRPIWHRLVLLASTIPIAILCNIVRVTVTGFIYVFGNPKYAQGIYHDLLGLSMLGIAFALYGCLAWFMTNIFVDEERLKPIKEDIIVRRNGGKSIQ
ncbi:MAG: exosortase/archaeosortase family protein [Phycisphaerales bacterium]|jgi:exosortase